MKALLSQKKFWPTVIAASFPLLTFIFLWPTSIKEQHFSIRPISTLIDTLPSLCLYLIFSATTALPFWQMYTAAQRNKYIHRAFYPVNFGGLPASAIVWIAVAHNTYTDYAQPLTSDPAGKFLSLLAIVFGPMCVWLLMQILLIVSTFLHRSK